MTGSGSRTRSTAASRTAHEKVAYQQGVNYENHRSLAAPLRRRPRPAAAGGGRAGSNESVPERARSDVRDPQRDRRSVRCRHDVGVERRDRLRRRHRVLPDDRRLVRDRGDLPRLHGDPVVDRVDRAAHGYAWLRRHDDQHQLDVRSAAESRDAAHGRPALPHQLQQQHRARPRRRQPARRRGTFDGRRRLADGGARQPVVESSRCR